MGGANFGRMDIIFLLLVEEEDKKVIEKYIENQGREEEIEQLKLFNT